MTLIPLHESDLVEFKESLQLKSDAAADLCAFANTNGGTVYFGVSDKGKVIGISEVGTSTLKQLADYYHNQFDPSLAIQVDRLKQDNQNIIAVSVSKSEMPCHTYKGICYRRSGPVSLKMKQDEYKRLLRKYDEGYIDYSSKIISGGSLDDLDATTISRLRDLLRSSGRAKGYNDQMPVRELLVNLRLMTDKGVTLAALVLLGTGKSLKQYLPFAEIRYGYRISASELRNQDVEIFEGGYLGYYDLVWDKINQRNTLVTVPEGMLLRERKAFDQETIREAINNAIIHRDYRDGESIVIIQYPTKIEIKSPGGLVDGVTVQNILDASKPRNKLIAEVLQKCGLVEQFGSGVDIMFQHQLSNGKAPPSYDQSTDRNVLLELEGAIQDPEFARYVLRVANEKQISLSDKDLLMLYHIKNGEKVLSSTRLEKLLRQGLIEKIGYGKWALSKKYYKDTGNQVYYTKRKGINKLRRKELILQHLGEFPDGATAKDIEDLLELYPMATWRLLKELKDEGRIISSTTGSKNIWVLVK